MSKDVDESCMKCRAWLILCLVLIMVPPADAAQDPHEAQVSAAAADAANRLRADIETTSLSPDLNVGEFLKRTNTCDQFTDMLRHADQIGGPRWMDNETCQVKLAVSADRVRETLAKFADDNSRTSPLPADAIVAKLHVWGDQTFTATGASISAQRAEKLRPPDASGAWRQVSDESRRATIQAARRNAVDRVIDSIKTINISSGRTANDLLADQQIGDAFRAWLAARPVTRLEFKNDLSIAITLAADPRDVFEALCDLAGKSDALPKDRVELARVRNEFRRQMAAAVGSARVGGDPAGAARGGVHIPNQPPQWITQVLNTEATQKPQGTRLKTARAAENVAVDALRKKVDDLTIDSTTLGEAAKRDSAVERAIEQAMGRAKAYKIEYLPDGSVSVKVSLDSRDLWDELRELP
jgi:hypothetical protein